MLKPIFIKVSAIVALILCSAGLLFSAYLTTQSFVAAFGCVSWALLLWASYIGFRLSSYKLQEDEFKKVAIRIYLIIAAALISAFTGLIIGIVISVLILSTLWSLKSNYDSWVEIPVNTDGQSLNERRQRR